jgi:excisionase family DNA binding protein
MYLWTINELSSSTKLAISTLRHYVSDGLIPVVRIGRAVRFDPDEIKAWVAAGGPHTITNHSKK